MPGSVINVLIAGDARKLRSALGEADGALGKFSKGVGIVAKAAAASFAAIGAAAAVGLYKAAQAAADDQKSQKLLADQLKRTMGANDEQIASIERFIGKAQLATGVVDDELRPAFGNLVRATGDAEESQRLLNLSLDIAAATGRDLESVSLAIGKASNGQLSALTRLGVPLDANIVKSKDFASALEGLEGQFGGAALGAADTFEGRMQILKTTFGEIQEQVGYAVLPVLEGLATTLTDKVMPVVQQTVDEFTQAFNKDGIGGVFKLLGDKIAEAVPIIQQKLTELGQKFVDWIGPRIQPMLQKLGELLSQAATWLVTVGLPMLQDKLVQLGVALIEWVGPQIPPLLEKIAGLIGRLGAWLLETGLPRLVDNLKKLGDALVAWVGPNIAPLLKQLGIMIGRVVSWILTDGIPQLLKVALEIAGALTKWAFELLPPILKGLGQLVWELVKALPGLFVDLVVGIGKVAGDLGKRLVEGMWDGITGMSGWLLDKLKEWAGNLIPGWLKDILGIESPSKVTAAIGEQVAAGMAVGIMEGSTMVFRASENLGKGLETALAGGSKKAIGKARKAIEDELKKIAAAAEDTMDSIKKQAQSVLDFAADLQQSLGRFGSVATFDTMDPDNKPTAKGVIQNMADRLKTIRAFGDNLRSLAGLGLNNASLQEIIAAGPEAGNQIAAALLKEGQSAVSQVNSLQEQVFGAASDLAEFATQANFGMGTAQARAQINSSVVIESGAVVINVNNDTNGDGIADTVETAMREVAEQIARDEVTRQLDYFGGEIERTSGGLARLVNL